MESLQYEDVQLGDRVLVDGKEGIVYDYSSEDNDQVAHILFKEENSDWVILPTHVDTYPYLSSMVGTPYEVVNLTKSRTQHIYNIEFEALDIGGE